jgi:putative transcriptional regulator
MNKTGAMRVTVNSGEEPPRGETDWAAVRARTDEEVLAADLSDPDAQPLDPEALAKMRRVPLQGGLGLGGPPTRR